MQGRTLSVIGVVYVREANAARRRYAPINFRFVLLLVVTRREERLSENLIDSLHGDFAIHSCVVLCSKLTQWLEKFGREEQNKESRLKWHVPNQQAQANFDGDDGGADGCRFFKYEGREKCNAQRTHSCAPETLAHGTDLFFLRLTAPKEFERSQTLQNVEKVSAQQAQ